MRTPPLQQATEWTRWVLSGQPVAVRGRCWLVAAVPIALVSSFDCSKGLCRKALSLLEQERPRIASNKTLASTQETLQGASYDLGNRRLFAGGAVAGAIEKSLGKSNRDPAEAAGCGRCGGWNSLGASKACVQACQRDVFGVQKNDPVSDTELCGRQRCLVGLLQASSRDRSRLAGTAFSPFRFPHENVPAQKIRFKSGSPGGTGSRSRAFPGVSWTAI